MMTPSLPEAVTGKYHNDMANMASDTVLRFTTLPRLMLTMLESEGWRYLERPMDHRRFENKTIADWVLGAPWPGLHFPNWATLYAILDKNVEVGKECLRRLQEVGAPNPKDAETAFHARAAREAGRLAEHGEIGKGHRDYNIMSATYQGTSAEYLSRRLLRDAPETFAALERGEFPSVHAAATAAGILRKKTPLERLSRLWKQCSHEEQATFLAWIRAQEEVR